MIVQGEIFAAEGYAKVTGQVGVCIATSGPGATNLVTGLADALLDSVPVVAITGQVITVRFGLWDSSTSVQLRHSTLSSVEVWVAMKWPVKISRNS